jgi:hypothetical protein
MVVSGLLLAACTSSPKPVDRTTTQPIHQMQAEVASIDLYTGTPQRVEVGLFLGDGRVVTFGTVSFSFGYAGTEATPTSPEPGADVTASYLPTPGTPDGTGRSPALSQPTSARGVYQAASVTFDRAGFWTVSVTADVSGETQSATTTFQVRAEPLYPAPGQPAMPTQNLTIDSKGVPKAAIDSRYTISGTIPDPELHEWTIAEAISQHRPAVVIFSTPVYCISRFCGPETNLIERLARKYADRAVFIHVEIWRDFTKQVVNQAAAEWVYRGGDVTEPWIFLIGGDGTIQDRWNSLVDPKELSAELAKLPVMKGPLSPPRASPTP